MKTLSTVTLFVVCLSLSVSLYSMDRQPSSEFSLDTPLLASQPSCKRYVCTSCMSFTLLLAVGVGLYYYFTKKTAAEIHDEADPIKNKLDGVILQLKVANNRIEKLEWAVQLMVNLTQNCPKTVKFVTPLVEQAVIQCRAEAGCH